MKTTKLYMNGLVAIMIFAFSQQTFSQDSRWAFGSHYQSFINTLVTNQIWKMSTRNSTKPKPKSSGVSKSSDASPTTLIIDPAADRLNRAVQFKSTGTRLKVQGYAEMIDPVPEDRAETRKMLSRILDKYDAEALERGQRNDFAQAVISYIYILASVYHEQLPGPLETILQNSFERGQESRNALGEAFVRDGSLAKMTERQKQEGYEVLIMTAGFIYQRYETAKKERNAEELKHIKTVVAGLLKDRGINL